MFAHCAFDFVIAALQPGGGFIRREAKKVREEFARFCATCPFIRKHPPNHDGLTF